MSETYKEQLSRVRLMAEGDDTWDLSDNDTAALTAILGRLDGVEKTLEQSRNISCIYCGYVTQSGGRLAEEVGAEINQHILTCEKRPERRLFAGLVTLVGVLGCDIGDVAPHDTDALMLKLADAMQRTNPMHMMAEWHRTFNVPMPDAPQLPPMDRRTLRIELIEEEFRELKKADAESDIVAYADGLADLVYVAYAAALEWGIPLDRVLAEVHRSNMTKVNPDGSITYREDGKVLKPPTYSKADIAKVLGL